MRQKIFLVALFTLALIFTSFTLVRAVVIRSGVPDSKYLVPDSAFPSLVDLPGEGHGVLIAPRWVITATHAISWQSAVNEVSINGKPRKVAGIFKHPGYRKLPDSIIKPMLATGNTTRACEFLMKNNDITLIELSSPVRDITPMQLYHGIHEQGKIVEIVGKGATGDGVKGQHGSHRTNLRRAFNVVTDVNAHWLWYTFDAPPAALPLEGIAGSGDSGGPVILEDHGKKRLIGLASWNKYGRGFKPGFYGQIVYNVRVSGYITWINQVISEHTNNHPE